MVGAALNVNVANIIDTYMHPPESRHPGKRKETPNGNIYIMCIYIYNIMCVYMHDNMCIHTVEVSMVS